MFCSWARPGTKHSLRQQSNKKKTKQKTKQYEIQTKTNHKKQSKAEINYAIMQQQQLQQAVQMPSASAGGSYVFAETSGTGTVECDCGEDCCPNCNLLLQMSGSGW